MSLEDLKKMQQMQQEKCNDRLNKLGRDNDSVLNSIGNITPIQTLQKQKQLLVNIKSKLKGEENSSNKRENILSNIQNYSARIIEQVDKMIKENSMELVFVIDRSSSCKGTEESTMTGFNNLIEKIKRADFNKILVTVILFSEGMQTLYYRVPIDKIEQFEYRAAGGATALYNTLFDSIEDIKNIHLNEGSNAPKETVFAIMTDGYDNVAYTKEDTIRYMIKERISKGWKFIMLGALESIEEVNEYAKRIGIPSNHAQLYLKEYTETNFLAIENVISSIYTTGHIADNWSDIIKETLNKNTIKIEDDRQYRLEYKD